MDLPYVRENLGRIFDSSAEGLRRIRAIVQNLRDFARLDEAEYKEVDLNTALNPPWSPSGTSSTRRRSACRPTSRTSRPVACHPGKINQVFFNILLNAIQASAREGLIEVRTRPDREEPSSWRSKTTAEGSLPSTCRTSSSPSSRPSPWAAGTGLGLSVSYGIVRDHGGALEVESTVGRGSLFRVRLPLNCPEPDDRPRPAP